MTMLEVIYCAIAAILAVGFSNSREYRNHPHRGVMFDFGTAVGVAIWPLCLLVGIYVAAARRNR